MPVHAQKQNLRSPSLGSGMARARGDRQHHRHHHHDAGISERGSLRCVTKAQPEVAATIFSLSWLISSSLFTLQPVYISKLCIHQSMTPSPYEEISDQLALIRAVLVSRIIAVSLLLSAIHTSDYKHTCKHKCSHTHTGSKFRATVTLFAF